ncbi:MAG: Gfo/Idh/MocA family oxidoreductase [Cyclobacteriaceae bacterium]
MEKFNDIRWGILGCGDVCEIKSGPALNKVNHSKLIAVMRRDGKKAKDFARRHGAPKYYDDANLLINDPEVNAVYIATPPAFHEEYAIQCMKAGKPVYIEKPVALTSESCERMLAAAQEFGVSASVAHYRRGLAVFKKIRSLLESGIIGTPSLILSNTLQAPSEKMKAADYWRTSPEISGGGLFFDLAPHQLDIFYWLFGKPYIVRGFSVNQKSAYDAPDLTNVEAVFGDGVYLHGIWAFNLNPASEQETTEIIGERGKIVFSFFRKSDIDIITADGKQTITLDYPENIQQPMIDEVVKFFRSEGPNPCSLEDALVSMRMMDSTRQSLVLSHISH